LFLFSSAVKDDPDFGPLLQDRTTIDIKDKYRNLFSKSRGQQPPRSSSPQPVYAKEATVATPRAAQAPVAPAGQHTESIADRASKRTRQLLEEDAKRDFVPSILTSMATSGNGNPGSKNSNGNSSAAASAKADSMMVTLAFDQRSYVLNLKGSTKGSQLLAFAKQEFRLVGDNYTLHSEGVGKTLDPLKGLRDQIPMFDLVKVVKNGR
jgi:hypothetical protein